MSLTIRKLTTICLAPPEHASLKTVVDRFARNRLAGELGEFLGPSLDRQPEVVRIRRLAVRVEIRAADLTEDCLPRAWVAAVSRALFETIAYPDGNGAAQLRRYATRAAYLAEAARELALHRGDAAYPHEAAATEYGTAAGLIDGLIAGEAALLEAVLLELYSGRSLELLLAQMDDIALEKLLRALQQSGASPVSKQGPIALLLGVAAAIAQEKPLRGWALRNRRNAIRMWVQLLKGGTRWPPRSIWAALQTLAILMDHPELFLAADAGTDRSNAVLQDGPEILREIRGQLAYLEPSALAREREAIFRAVKAVAPTHAAIAAVPDAAALQSTRQNQRWVSCEAGGLLLLAAVIRRLDWWRVLPEQVFRYVAAGAGAILAGQHYAKDPAVSLLAGAIEDFDHRAMANHLATAAPPAVELGVAANSWDELFQLAAELLARNLAERIRGFRKASMQTIQKNILRRPGRILIEQARILVVLDKHAWNPAMHLSGVDDAIESVEWLGGRRMEFVLEGV